MKYLIGVVLVLALSITMTACVEDSEADTNDDKYIAKEFNIISQGWQTDLPGGRILNARNQDVFNEIWLTIPSISGQTPYPDFESNQVAVILTGISACSSLELSSVEEDDYTTLITITEVYTEDPGLCDPTVEAFSHNQYVMLEFIRDPKPVSVLFDKRNEY